MTLKGILQVFTSLILIIKGFELSNIHAEDNTKISQNNALNKTSKLNFGSNNSSVLGQVIFDPLGYEGGVALGTGQGKNTKLAIVVDKNNYIIFKSSISSPILTAAAGYIDSEKRVTGQGTMQTWNMFYPGNAHTEFTNIDPLGDRGGFDFYDIKTRDIINTKDPENSEDIQKTQPIFRVGKTETFFDVQPTMKKGVSISSSLPVSFPTGSLDGNNQTVYMFYNPYNSNKQREISESESNRIGYNQTLDKDTFYFTNLRYGNKYKFDGNVTAQELFVNNTPVMQGGYEAVSPYNNDKVNLISLTKQGEGNVVGYDWNNVRRNTLMIGGNDRSSNVGIKANCQTTSSGDEGGSCYQFINMSGPQYDHRSGSGGSDSVNMDIRSANSSPIDVIGGNKLVQNPDGSYIVKGNEFFLAENTSAGANKFKIKGIFGCGLTGMHSSGKTKCVLTGINVLDANGNLVNPKTTQVIVTPEEYIPSNQIDKNGKILDDGITTVKLSNNFKLKDALTTENSVNIKFYSADDKAYAVKLEKARAIIYPALSEKEANLIHLRMAIWTNYAKNMQDTEQGGSNKSGVDLPNYYYGYNAENPLTTINDYNGHPIATIIKIETYAYPGSNLTKPGWISYSSSQPIEHAPGSNDGDNLDYRLTYKNIKDKNIFIRNTNYHHYSQPTLFLGLSDKNFNLYLDQAYINAPDSITRNYDNEWDFMLHSSRDGMLASHGLTMTWGQSLKNGEHNGLFSNDSYMLNLSGADLMPQGLLINGVTRKGGQSIRTDAGFGVYKWAYPMQELDKAGKAQTIAALGQAKTKTGSYQLISYMSNDGSNHNYAGLDPTNNSLHLGLTKLNLQVLDNKHPFGDDGITLEQNTSPTCEGLNFGSNNCFVLGQVIFDPLGYEGGVALGTGQGKNTKLAIVVDKNNYIIFKSSISSPILTAAAGYIDSEKRVTGQGTMQTWNMFYPGNAHTEFTNIDPLGDRGGFDFYDIKTRDIINTKDPENSEDIQKTQPIFRVGKTETFFDVQPTMKKGVSISSSLPVSFPTGSLDGNNQTVYMFYNPYNSNKQREISESESNRIGYNQTLDKDTFYFTNLRYGNKYKFDGNVNVTEMITAKKIKISLSTPSSSSENCSAGEFKDDTNYHYVCVATNKWKRVALSDF